MATVVPPTVSTLLRDFAVHGHGTPIAHCQSTDPLLLAPYRTSRTRLSYPTATLAQSHTIAAVLLGQWKSRPPRRDGPCLSFSLLLEQRHGLPKHLGEHRAAASRARAGARWSWCASYRSTPAGYRCSDGESGPVLYVRSSAQIVHVQYAFDTGIPVRT